MGKLCHFQVFSVSYMSPPPLHTSVLLQYFNTFQITKQTHIKLDADDKNYVNN